MHTHPVPGQIPRNRLRIAIGIATAGRPDILARTLDHLSRQVRKADCVVVCMPAGDDVPSSLSRRQDVRLVSGPRGLPAQRNTILRDVQGYDVLLFLDDDFVPAPDYVAVVENVFAIHGDIAMTTGRVLADGILTPGYSFDAAERIIEDDDASSGGMVDVYNGYGCNMAVRLAPVHAGALVFDEELPLYAWLEDIDFSRRVAACGRIVRVERARGVHLGVKGGRQSGRRLGYSQIANPFYLARKGTFAWTHALFLMSRNLAANTAKSLRPEPYVDRTGRLSGNLRALVDLVAGRLRPSRALEL